MKFLKRVLPLVFSCSHPGNGAVGHSSGTKIYMVSNAEIVKLENICRTQFLHNYTRKIYCLMKRKEHRHFVCANFMHTVCLGAKFNFSYA